ESRQEVNADRISSASLVSTLVAIEDGPWGEYGRSGKPLTQAKLGRLLNQPGLHIKPHGIRIGEKTPRGYLLSDFADALARLLPPEGGFKVQQCNKCDEMGTSDTIQSATSETNVALRKCEKPDNDGPCCTVALPKGGKGGNGHASVRNDLDDCSLAPDGTPDDPDPEGLQMAHSSSVQDKPTNGSHEPADRPTPDDGMPTDLRRCYHCGKQGAERWDWHDGRAVYLHAACEHAWADQQDGGR